MQKKKRMGYYFDPWSFKGGRLRINFVGPDYLSGP